MTPTKFCELMPAFLVSCTKHIQIRLNTVSNMMLISEPARFRGFIIRMNWKKCNWYHQFRKTMILHQESSQEHAAMPAVNIQPEYQCDQQDLVRLRQIYLSMSVLVATASTRSRIGIISHHDIVQWIRLNSTRMLNR